MNDHIFCTPDMKIKGCEFGICSECPHYDHDTECEVSEMQYEDYEEM